MLTLFVNMNVLVEKDLVCSITSSSACNYAFRLFEYLCNVATPFTCCGPLITLKLGMFIIFVFGCVNESFV